MAKRLEDMVKTKRIKPEIRKELPLKELPPKETKKVWETVRVEADYNLEIGTNYKKSKPRYFLWIVAAISVAFCFFAISFLFAKAEVSVNPKTEDVVLNENLSADKDSNANGLSYDLVIIPGEVNENLQATGEKKVSTKATGTVVIFNAFSSSAQKLSVNTRLEGSNGKIYETQTATIVPGMSKSGIPGQVEVGIYALAAGQEYNSAPLDFNILGFKGTPKYSKFNVRSKAGTAITGGFIGMAPDISSADQATAESSLKVTLLAGLLQKATSQIPDGFILYKNAVFLDTNDSNLSSVYNTDNTATLTLSGTLYGIILSEQELTKKIAQDNIDKYDGSNVYIPNIKNLIFSLPAQAGMSPVGVAQTNGNTVTLADLQSINFNLSGPAKIVWKLDVNKFISDLLGKPKGDFTQILSQYSNIDSATLSISPIWKMSIPDQAKDVKVIVNYPN